MTKSFPIACARCALSSNEFASGRSLDRWFVGRTAALVVLGYGSLSQQCLDGDRLLSSEWRPAGAERRRWADSHLAMPGPRPKPKPEMRRAFRFLASFAPPASTPSFHERCGESRDAGMPLVVGKVRRRSDGRRRWTPRRSFLPFPVRRRRCSALSGSIRPRNADEDH